MRQEPSQRGGAGPGYFPVALDVCSFLKFGIVKFNIVKFNPGGGLCLFAG